MERLSYRSAIATIVPNESFRKIAIDRGYCNPEKITVVRSGPDLNRIRPATPDYHLKKGKSFLIGYLGVICKQDSMDDLMRIIGLLTARRQDVHFAVVGDGPELRNIMKVADDLAITDYITFFGMVHEPSELATIMSSCDLCVNPDRFDEFNDIITTIKLMEYMAFAKPIVQFSLTEGRYTTQEASLYAENGNLSDFAEKISHLLDHEEERNRRGALGYKRVIDELSWEHEQVKLEGLYRKLCGRSA